MKFRTLLFIGGLFAAVAGALNSPSAAAQSYPTSTPVYNPAAVLAPVTLSAPGTVVFQVNGLDAMTVSLTGTNTGIVGAVQVANTRGGTTTWTTVSAVPVGGSSKPTKSITANGLYRVYVGGMAQARLNLTALGSGSVVVALAGTGNFFHIPVNVDLGALITNTAQAAGTVNSPDQSGAEVTTVECVFNQTANTAGNTVFSIQNKDAASGLYYTLITSAATTTANNTPSAIAAGAGVQASANVSSSLPIGATWRVQEVASGTSTTGTIGCTAH